MHLEINSDCTIYLLKVFIFKYFLKLGIDSLLYIITSFIKKKNQDFTSLITKEHICHVGLAPWPSAQSSV
jgi:hypothetical protein